MSAVVCAGTRSFGYSAPPRARSASSFRRRATRRSLGESGIEEVVLTEGGKPVNARGSALFVGERGDVLRGIARSAVVANLEVEARFLDGSGGADRGDRVATLDDL